MTQQALRTLPADEEAEIIGRDLPALGPVAREVEPAGAGIFLIDVRPVQSIGPASRRDVLVAGRPLVLPVDHVDVGVAADPAEVPHVQVAPQPQLGRDRPAGRDVQLGRIRVIARAVGRDDRRPPLGQIERALAVDEDAVGIDRRPVPGRQADPITGISSIAGSEHEAGRDPPARAGIADLHDEPAGAGRRAARREERHRGEQGDRECRPVSTTEFANLHLNPHEFRVMDWAGPGARGVPPECG